MDIEYINHRGDRLNLSDWPYVLQTENLFDYTWSYEAVNSGERGGYINAFYKDVKEIGAGILVHAQSQAEFNAAMRRFHEVTEVDVTAKKPGRLTLASGEYMLCYFTGSEKTMWSRGIRTALNGLKIVTEKPFWCQDVTYSYAGTGLVSGDFPFLDFPFDFPFDMTIGSNTGLLTNRHYAGAEFKMTIYGPAENPRIRIGGNLYHVDTILYPAEYMVVDSRAKSITRYRTDGSTVNDFNLRDKTNNVFAMIPPGTSIVQRTV